MNRTQSELAAYEYELDYACSYRSRTSSVPCRELSGTEKRNRSARYSKRPSPQSSATKGIHRRGARCQAA